MKEALRGAASIRGVETQAINIAGMRIEPCMGCPDPHTGKDQCILKCKIKDDMQKIYPKLLEADGIIIGTSVYFGNVSGKLKNLINRCSAIKLRRYKTSRQSRWCICCSCSRAWRS